MDIDEETSEEYRTKEAQELKICITLNGAELCRPYTFDSVAELNPKKVCKEVEAILSSLLETDKQSI